MNERVHAAHAALATIRAEVCRAASAHVAQDTSHSKAELAALLAAERIAAAAFAAALRDVAV
jgi:hypothetical protein